MKKKPIISAVALLSSTIVSYPSVAKISDAHNSDHVLKNILDQNSTLEIKHEAIAKAIGTNSINLREHLNEADKTTVLAGYDKTYDKDYDKSGYDKAYSQYDRTID